MVTTSESEALDEDVHTDRILYISKNPTFLSNSTEKVHCELKIFLLMFSFWYHKNKPQTPMALKA